MSVHIITTGETGLRADYFYKTVSKNIIYSAMSRSIKDCHISIDLNNKRDINKLKEYLNLLENVMVDK